jgi:hypothetical protein
MVDVIVHLEAFDKAEMSVAAAALLLAVEADWSEGQSVLFIHGLLKTTSGISRLTWEP